MHMPYDELNFGCNASHSVNTLLLTASAFFVTFSPCSLYVNDLYTKSEL